MGLNTVIMPQAVSNLNPSRKTVPFWIERSSRRCVREAKIAASGSLSVIGLNITTLVCSPRASLGLRIQHWALKRGISFALLSVLALPPALLLDLQIEILLLLGLRTLRIPLAPLFNHLLLLRPRRKTVGNLFHRTCGLT